MTTKGICRKITVLILFLVYLAIGTAIIITWLLFLDFKKKTGSSREGFEALGLRYYTLTRHTTVMLPGFLISGLSMIAFRALSGTIFCFVKYIHILFHTSAMVLFIIGWYIAAPDAPKGFHQYLGYHLMVSLFIQVCENCYLFVFGKFTF